MKGAILVGAIIQEPLENYNCLETKPWFFSCFKLGIVVGNRLPLLFYFMYVYISSPRLCWRVLIDFVQWRCLVSLRRRHRFCVHLCILHILSVAPFLIFCWRFYPFVSLKNTKRWPVHIWRCAGRLWLGLFGILCSYFK